MADNDLKESIERLETLRDELRVQLHLAKAEARDEWNRLEASWLKVEDELKAIREEAKGPAREIGHATRQILDDLKRGYGRLRDQLG